MNKKIDNIVIEMCIGKRRTGKMKKNLIILLVLAFGLFISPCFAAPGGHGPGGGPGIRAANYHGGGMRGPVHHGHISAGTPHRPMAGRPPMGPHYVGRPLPPTVYRPYRPIFRPYFYSYYPTTYYTSYSYYPSVSYETVTPVAPVAETVVVRDDYAGINTAANIINAAANVAATIKYLTW